MTKFRTVLTLALIAFAGVLAGIPLVTIDHDEGFFFHTAQSAVATGRFSFPWTEEFLGKVHFIPLNSLLPLLLTATVPAGEQALWLGRLLSSLAFLIGLLALTRFVSWSSSNQQQGRRALVLAATALPLWQYARIIRPEAYVFMLSCLVIYVAITHPGRHAWLLGVLTGLACLAHGVHGSFVALLAGTLLVAQSEKRVHTVLTHLAGLFVGAATVLGVFYSWYGRHAGDLLHQITLFAKISPGVTSPANPLEQLISWFLSLRTQVQEVPIIIAAAGCLFWRGSRVRPPAAVAMEVTIATFYLVIVFFYPKKTMTSVCVVLPAVIGWVVLTGGLQVASYSKKIGRVAARAIGLGRERWAPLAGVVPGPGTLDLDHLGSQIRQHLGRPRPGQNARQVEDGNAGKGALGLGHALPLARHRQMRNAGPRYSPGSQTPASRIRHSRASSARLPMVRAVALISSDTVVLNTPGTRAWQKAQADNLSSLKPNRPEAAICSR